MENFLLLLDELDDACAMLRAIWWQCLGFLIACGFFAGTVLAALRWPLELAMATAVIALYAMFRMPPVTLPRLKTDP